MYGLTKAELDILFFILKKYAKNIFWVKLFGSRARGDFRKTSDIDLAFLLRNPILHLIRDDFEQSGLPYTVDLVDYSQAGGDLLKDKINRDGRVLFLTNAQGDIEMTSERLNLKFVEYQKAVDKLKKAIEKNPELDDLYLDGTIQRFEFSYELSWKLIKDYLSYEGIEVSSPRSCIREGFKVGLIQDPTQWLDMLEKRNLSSHTYNEMTAQEIYRLIRDVYISLFIALEFVMKKKIKAL